MPNCVYFSLLCLDQKTILDQRESLGHSVSHVPSTVPATKQGTRSLCRPQGSCSPQTWEIQATQPTQRSTHTHMGRRHCRHHYTPKPGEHLSTDYVGGSEGKESPRGAGRGTYPFFCNIAPQRETEWEQDGLSEVQEINCSYSVGSNNQRFLKTESNSEGRRATCHSHVPTLVTLPRGLFRVPEKKVIFLSSSKAWTVSYLSSARLCLARCQLWRPWDFSHLLSPAVLSNRGFKNSLLQVFRGQVPFLPKMCGMEVSWPQWVFVSELKVHVSPPAPGLGGLPNVTDPVLIKSFFRSDLVPRSLNECRLFERGVFFCSSILGNV